MKVRRVLTEDSWKFLPVSFGRCEIQQEAGIIKKFMTFAHHLEVTWAITICKDSGMKHMKPCSVASQHVIDMRITCD